MRFVQNGVSEVVVTTDGPGGGNAAPMGLIERDGAFLLRVFEGSTRRNLKRTGEGVLNVTRDPVTIAVASLGEGVELRERPTRLASAEWYAPFEVLDQRDSSVDDELGESELTVFTVEIGEAFEGSGEPVTLSRGACAAISAAVHASRAAVAEERGLDEKAAELRRRLELEASRVERLGGDRAREAVEIIREALR
ncbi:MAG: hypothetical protein MAG715_00591 [Methanonatronarchaeales archaeon]|nr:hypothetical protein [Methanonatronarchaeales archaeon]